MEFGDNTNQYEEEQTAYQGEVEYGEKNSYGDNNGYAQTSYTVRQPLGILPICILSGAIMWVSGFILGMILLFLFGQWMHYNHLAFGKDSNPSYTYYVHQMKSYRTGFFIALGVMLFIKVIFFFIGTVTLVSSVLL